MLRSKRLEVVLTLEQRREHEALEALAKAQKHYQAMQERMGELAQYHEDYREQMRQGQQGVVAVSRLQGWQAFIAQLNQVMEQQQRQVDSAAANLDESRKNWQQAYERRQGMEKHIANCRDQEQRERDTQEQKIQDEATTRAYRLRR